MRIILLALISSAVAVGPTNAAEHWPKRAYPREATAAVLEQYIGPYAIFHDEWYRDFLSPYKPFGDYLNYGTQRRFVNDGEVMLNGQGVPQILNEGRPYYNPVTIAQYTLSLYPRPREAFLAAADKLISLQSPDGAFRYPIRLAHHAAMLEQGWMSAMAQGQALSVLARAVKMTGNAKYKRAGRLALTALLRPVENGGGTTSLAGLDRSLTEYRWYAEYPTRPTYYTLNGFMFTLLGLYDWSKADTRPGASLAYRQGMRTLQKILPLYDIDGLSAYDLRHIIEPGTAANLQKDYEGVHVYLLHALNSITSSDVLAKYERRWADKIEELDKPLRFRVISLSKPSPQPPGTEIRIDLGAASSEHPKPFFQVMMKHAGEWTMLQAYSDNPNVIWRPTEPGHYDIGLYVRREGSNLEYENFRVTTFEITEPSARP